MWTSAAGAAAQSQNVEIIANNLANADTVGFKKDLPTFREYLTTLEREHGPEDIPRGAFKDKDFYPLDGRDQAYVVMDNTYTNFKQGTLKVTHSPWDFAIEGPGFLEVSTPFGPRFTRQGSLKLSPEGRIVTTEGFPVMNATSRPDAGPAATPPLVQGQGRVPAGLDLSRAISVRDRQGAVNIAQDGSVFVGDDFVGKLSLVEFTDLNKLRKVGGGMFENKEAANFAQGPLRSFARQGMIELSNVNPVEEMVNLIKANRLFEHDMKALKTYGEILGKEATEVGKL